MKRVIDKNTTIEILLDESIGNIIIIGEQKNITGNVIAESIIVSEPGEYIIEVKPKLPKNNFGLSYTEEMREDIINNYDYDIINLKPFTKIELKNAAIYSTKNEFILRNGE